MLPASRPCCHVNTKLVVSPIEKGFIGMATIEFPDGTIKHAISEDHEGKLFSSEDTTAVKKMLTQRVNDHVYRYMSPESFND